MGLQPARQRQISVVDNDVVPLDECVVGAAGGVQKCHCHRLFAEGHWAVRGLCMWSSDGRSRAAQWRQLARVAESLFARATTPLFTFWLDASAHRAGTAGTRDRRNKALGHRVGVEGGTGEWWSPTDLALVLSAFSDRGVDLERAENADSPVEAREEKAEGRRPGGRLLGEVLRERRPRCLFIRQITIRSQISCLLCVDEPGAAVVHIRRSVDAINSSGCPP